MRFYTLITIIALCFNFVSRTSFAQQMSIDWENTIGGDCWDCARDIISLPSAGGFVVVGYSCSGASYDQSEQPIGGAGNNQSHDYWVMKLDINGDIEWQNTIGGELNDVATSIEPTSDGGYIIGGISFSGISGDKTESNRGVHDYWIVKINGLGEVEWDKTIGSAEADELRTVHETSDGGFLLAGHTLANISGDKDVANFGDRDVWIVKLDVNREIEWQKVYGGTAMDDIGYRPIEIDSDGNIYVGTYSQSGIGGNKTEEAIGALDYWILKLTPTGDILWQQTIGGTGFDAVQKLVLGYEGQIFAIGSSNSNISGDKSENFYGTEGYGDFWVVKLDEGGNVLWDKTIGGNQSEEIYSAVLTETGGLILAGFSNSGATGLKTEPSLGDFDYWILELGANQNIIWQKTIGGNGYDKLYDMDRSSNGGVILAGCSDSEMSVYKTESNIEGTTDFWIVKMNPDNLVSISADSEGETRIWPNPTSQDLSIELPSQSAAYQVKIYDSLGRIIELKTLNSMGKSLFNVRELPAGVYTVEITSSNYKAVQKFVKN